MPTIQIISHRRFISFIEKSLCEWRSNCKRMLGYGSSDTIGVYTVGVSTNFKKTLTFQADYRVRVSNYCS